MAGVANLRYCCDCSMQEKLKFAFAIALAAIATQPPPLLRAQCQAMAANKPGALKTDSPAAGQPQFYDEPQFTVAGVTDTTNLGGHGSNVAIVNREALAREAASLGKSNPERDGIKNAQENSLRAAVQQHPNDFEANHRLGELLAAEGKDREALLPLKHASELKPDNYENAYLLAASRAATGDYAEAIEGIQKLIGQKDKAELHHLLADIHERTGNPLDAVREYQRAAEMDSSESNLFDWGAELLAHHATDPAIEVFTKGNHLFPSSARMLEGLGVAWYSRGADDQAVRCLCAASDLNPTAADPYLFLGKMQRTENSEPEGVAEKLERFAQLQPQNPLANYYYAVSLWKRRTNPDDAARLAQIEALLQKAVILDPQLDIAYLQLGMLYGERRDSARAIAAYEKAAAINPQMEEAHYRLSQMYRQTGDKTRAQRELQLYEQTSKQHEQEADRRRHDVQQFVYTLKDRSPAPPPSQ
jgi:tetratricopeptide (TPR) repeat protein